MAVAPIHDVVVRPLRQIPDHRGKVMHMLRCDDPWFKEFGEIYFSAVFPGSVKAWHLHKAMTLNYAVVVGRIKLVVYDDRPGSPSRGSVQEILSGEDDYSLITVPPGVWNGFTGLGASTSIVANCATHPHDPQEIVRIDPSSPDIPYAWGAPRG